MRERTGSLDANVESERALVLITYVLHLIGSIFVVPSLVALLLNYLKRRDAEPVLATHHVWMIRTFWWALLWVVVGGVTRFLLIGWLILGLVWLWYVFRHVLGLIRLANAEAMPS